MINIRTVANKYETPESMYYRQKRYTASGTGMLQLNKRAIDNAEKIKKIAGEAFSDFTFYYGLPEQRKKENPRLRVEFEGCESLSECLIALIPYMESGEIQFLGEDGAIWRKRYIPEMKGWIRETGTTVFTANEALKYVEEELDNTKRAMNHIIGELAGGIPRL